MSTPAFVETPPMEEDVPVLFDGDRGQLPLEARRAFALLLRARYVAAADNPVEWKALLANLDVLESRCHDMFLQLVVDRDYELAYKKQLRPDGLSVPILLKDEPYRRVETLLMVHARNVFRQQQGAGERAAFIDAEELVEYAMSFLASDETNLALRRREAEAAMTTLQRERVLDEVSPGRFRILPVIEVLLPVERLQELARWLKAGDAPVVLADDDVADETEPTDETEPEEAP